MSLRGCLRVIRIKERLVSDSSRCKSRSNLQASLKILTICTLSITSFLQRGVIKELKAAMHRAILFCFKMRRLSLSITGACKKFLSSTLIFGASMQAQLDGHKYFFASSSLSSVESPFSKTSFQRTSVGSLMAGPNHFSATIRLPMATKNFSSRIFCFSEVGLDGSAIRGGVDPLSCGGAVMLPASTTAEVMAGPV